MLTYSYPGQTPAPPSDVTIYFGSTPDVWSTSDDRQLIMIVDGERLNFGQVKRLSTYFSAGVVADTYGVNVSLADFLKLANAKSVEMSLGGDESRLAPDHMEALKDFASRMRP